MLVIENGTGMSNAESYVDVDYVDAYFLKRGNTDWDLIDNKEAAIVKSMDFFESSYTFKGEKLNETQALAFPRYINGLVEYPIRVKNAICELALKTATSDLLEDTEQRVKREKVGELEVEYDTNDSQSVKYNFVFNLIAPWLNSNGFSSQIVRTY